MTSLEATMQEQDNMMVKNNEKVHRRPKGESLRGQGSIKK